MVICKTAMCMSKLLGIQGGNLPIVTALVVILATLLPKQFAYVAPAGDAIGVVLMQSKIKDLQKSGGDVESMILGDTSHTGSWLIRSHVNTKKVKRTPKQVDPTHSEDSSMT